MRVLIYEPKYVGHFLGFATWTANAFSRLGHDVVFAVPKQAAETQQARVKLAKIHPAVDLQYVIDAPPRFEKWKNARFESHALVQDILRFRPEYLVAPSADFLVNGLLVNRHLRRAVRQLQGADFILHACPQAYPALGPRQMISNYVDRLCLQLAGTIQLHTVDPFAVMTENGPLALFGDRVRQLPHPFESLAPQDRQAAREKLGLPAGSRILATLGDLGVRKGTDLLLRSFFDLDRRDVEIFLCGVLSDEIRALLRERPNWVDEGRIHLRDEFVTDDDFAAAFYAVDGIWAGYPRQIGIASLLLFAADARCPVIAADNGSVGWMTREYGLGKTFEPHLSAATKTLRSFADGHGFEMEDEGAERLMSYHTLENFERELTRSIVSLQPPPFVVTSG